MIDNPSSDSQENELDMFNVIQAYVELLDKHFGSVCELDIVFEFQQAYQILDEFILAGHVQESSQEKVCKFYFFSKIWRTVVKRYQISFIDSEFRPRCRSPNQRPRGGWNADRTRSNVKMPKFQRLFTSICLHSSRYANRSSTNRSIILQIL